MPPPSTASNSPIPVWMRAIRSASMFESATGAAAAPPARAIDAAFARAGTAIGRSSNEFHASHCGQRPSQRVDSKPHALQKKTERVFATAHPSSTLRPRLVFMRNNESFNQSGRRRCGSRRPCDGGAARASRIRCNGLREGHRSGRTCGAEDVGGILLRSRSHAALHAGRLPHGVRRLGRRFRPRGADGAPAPQLHAALSRRRFPHRHLAAERDARIARSAASGVESRLSPIFCRGRASVRDLAPRVRRRAGAFAAPIHHAAQTASADRDRCVPHARRTRALGVQIAAHRRCVFVSIDVPWHVALRRAAALPFAPLHRTRRGDSLSDGRHRRAAARACACGRSKRRPDSLWRAGHGRRSRRRPHRGGAHGAAIVTKRIWS